MKGFLTHTSALLGENKSATNILLIWVTIYLGYNVCPYLENNEQDVQFHFCPQKNVII
jgi:hypothetical protein